MGDISNGTRILLTQYLLKRLTDEDHALSRDELIKRKQAKSEHYAFSKCKRKFKTNNNVIKDNKVHINKGNVPAER